MIFIHYPKCTTCKKAAKWLTDNGLDFESRDIVLQNPTQLELKKWIPMSNLPISRFFNTSGIKYRELNLKAVVKNSDEQTLIDLLTTDGKLVKRPILISGKTVLVGFNEQEWSEKLTKSNDKNRKRERDC